MMSNSDANIDEGTNKPKESYNIEQYKMLLRCSESGDLSEWNNWRSKNPKEEIWLVGAFFWGVNLEGANLNSANLQGAELTDAKLQGANLWDANLKGAKLFIVNLQGAELMGVKLQGAFLKYAIVDGETCIANCMIDKNTDFTGVGLDSARIDPGLKQLLEYNIRRKQWGEWYKHHRLLRVLVWLFWQMSDYGRSTRRIVGVFFSLAFAFAGIYCRWPEFLTVNGGDLRGFWHALYFSVVTMTTLGFGDIHANPDSWLGQGILMFQVLLGYVLLGALITRLAVLFTSGGPEGKFAKKPFWKW